MHVSQHGACQGVQQSPANPCSNLKTSRVGTCLYADDCSAWHLHKATCKARRPPVLFSVHPCLPPATASLLASGCEWAGAPSTSGVQQGWLAWVVVIPVVKPSLTNGHPWQQSCKGAASHEVHRPSGCSLQQRQAASPRSSCTNTTRAIVPPSAGAVHQRCSESCHDAATANRWLAWHWLQCTSERDPASVQKSMSAAHGSMRA
jgi:hypothetical protein